MSAAAYAPNPEPARDAIGWAVIEKGAIKVRTVSDTRRAAMVNFLITERNTMIYSSATDEQIERMWFQCRGEADIEMVTITRTHSKV